MASGFSDRKSNYSEDPIILYCARNSLNLPQIMWDLYEETKKHPLGFMAGAPEVIQFNQNLMRLIGAKRVLDIGLFTGVSALGAALTIPNDGEVISMDISDAAYNAHGRKIVESSEFSHKIRIELRPGLETLDLLIQKGQEGKFDFAFIDADKQNCMPYYEKCMKLIRSGGIITVDNALQRGRVLNPKDAASIEIDKLNKFVQRDERVDCSLLPIADGLLLIFKR